MLRGERLIPACPGLALAESPHERLRRSRKYLVRRKTAEQMIDPIADSRLNLQAQILSMPLREAVEDCQSLGPVKRRHVQNRKEIDKARQQAAAGIELRGAAFANKPKFPALEIRHQEGRQAVARSAAAQAQQIEQPIHAQNTRHAGEFVNDLFAAFFPLSQVLHARNQPARTRQPKEARRGSLFSELYGLDQQGGLAGAGLADQEQVRAFVVQLANRLGDQGASLPGVRVLLAHGAFAKRFGDLGQSRPVLLLNDRAGLLAYPDRDGFEANQWRW